MTTHDPEAESDILNPTFVPRGPADRELDWYFALADGATGNRSNFVDSLEYRPRGHPDDEPERRADAVHAQRKLRRWILALGDFDAGVLKAAYVARPWPLELREELGRLTGIVVRIAAAESGLPDDPDAFDALERRTAARLTVALAREPERIEQLRIEARPILRAAFTRYVAQRGGNDVPVVPGVG